MDNDVANGRCRRILIADPQPIFRHGLAALLTSAHPNWDIVESATLDDHRTQLANGVFNLLILESCLLGAETAVATPIRDWISCSASIVAITGSLDSIGVLGCLTAGAQATISRTDSTDQVLTTIETISVQSDQHTVPQATDDWPGGTLSVETSDTLNLTTRQFDVLRSLALGQSNKVIARDLGLSVSTVKMHLNTVFRALGARNRVEAVVRARPFQARIARQGH
jgi:two-component system nitrate/nitrite response regulator NarL